jgi:two-component system, NtrC family, nitrogen regulation response regulator NtrX
MGMTSHRILVVDDEADIRRLLQEILREEGFEVEAAANATEAREVRSRQLPDLILLDIWMPDTDGISLLREWSADPAEACPVVMMSGHGSVETAVEATRLGAFDFIEKPLSMSKLLLTVNRALEARRPRHAGLASGVPKAGPFGRSKAVQQLRNELMHVAAQAQPVLLLTEAGAEPEQLAQLLHLSSARAAGPLVAVSARMLQGDGAVAALGGDPQRSSGWLQQARGGTLFIADIDELPVAAQRLLAGVCRSGAVADVRIVASALPGAQQRMAASGAGADLYAELSALTVRVPPLRESMEDIPALLRRTAEQLSEQDNLRLRRFSVAAQNRLRNYPWPDNQRELGQLVRRVLQRSGPEEISLEEAERELAMPQGRDVALVQQDLLGMPLREAREHFERAYLTQQLKLCGGKVGQLAKRVGMERTHLYRKLRTLGIEIAASADD